MGTRPVLLPLKQRVTVQNSAPKNGAAHYARVNGRLQTLDRVCVCRAWPNLNGALAGPGSCRAGPRTQETADGAGGRLLRGARSGSGTPSKRSALPRPSGVRPSNARLYPRWPVTSSSARSSSPSAGLQGADGTRSRCPHPDRLRSGWPFRDPVPDGSFRDHGSGC
jgi:hypothetical protein